MTDDHSEVASGLINAIGLQGPGVDGFIQKYWPFLKELKVPTIINIWGTTVEEYALLRYLGRHLGITDMPPLRLPAQFR